MNVEPFNLSVSFSLVFNSAKLDSNTRTVVGELNYIVGAREML